MRYIRRIRYFIIACIAFLVVGFYAVVTFNLSFMGPIARALKNFSMTDIYTQILQSTGDPDTSQVITIVDMTELIERRDLAQALEDIMAYEPKAVGVDVVFEGLKPDSMSDRWLVDIASNYKNITWSCKFLDFNAVTQNYETEVHSFFTEEAHQMEGFTNMPRDLYEGLKRKVSIGGRAHNEMLPSFSLSVANNFADKEIMPLADKEIAINFKPSYFMTISAAEVVEHPELISNRIVLFGAMKEETDMHYTPLGKIPGVELLAYSIQTLINKDAVWNLPTWLTWVISFIIVMLTSWGLTKYKASQMRRRKSDFMKVFMTSLMVVGYIKFIWMAFLTWVGFMLYNLYSMNINLGWAFSGIAFLATAEGFYKVLFDRDEPTPSKHEVEKAPIKPDDDADPTTLLIHH